MTSPDGKRILSEKVSLDEMGFCSQMIRVPDTAVSGVYTVRIGPDFRQDGETTIRVGAYVPDRIRTKLEHAPLPAGPAAVKVQRIRGRSARKIRLHIQQHGGDGKFILHGVRR